LQDRADERAATIFRGDLGEMGAAPRQAGEGHGERSHTQREEERRQCRLPCAGEQGAHGRGGRDDQDQEVQQHQPAVNGGAVAGNRIGKTRLLPDRTR
jgi:hypothetical protein